MKVGWWSSVILISDMRKCFPLVKMTNTRNKAQLLIVYYSFARSIKSITKSAGPSGNQTFTSQSGA
jgi:hypothetical protein